MTGSFSCFIFLQQPVHDEQTVVVSQAEYQCRYNDVDDVELYARHGHDAQYPEPADEHGNEGDQGKFYSPVHEQQHKEHQQRGH